MRGAASETKLLQQKLSNITSHPFVNFFLELCKSRDGLHLDDLAKKAGKLWQEMDLSEKVPYYRLARKVKKIGKSKKGLDLPRDKIRRRRPRKKPKVSQVEQRKSFLVRKRTNGEYVKEEAHSSRTNQEKTENGSTTDCNSVEKYCLDLLDRRYSRSSTYESD